MQTQLRNIVSFYVLDMFWNTVAPNFSGNYIYIYIYTYRSKNSEHAINLDDYVNKLKTI